MANSSIVIILYLAILVVLSVLFQSKVLKITNNIWSFICETSMKIKNAKWFLEICLLFLAGTVTCLILYFSREIITDETSENFRASEIHETIRNIILALGGVGGLYGLIIARKRQDRFEKQTNDNQKQVFNDQLGRGVEMLTNQDQTSIRMAGIRVLQKLGQDA